MTPNIVNIYAVSQIVKTDLFGKKSEPKQTHFWSNFRPLTDLYVENIRPMPQKTTKLKLEGI